ncbi:unnamed protein product [Amoebophrya sp. A120]|nr:unnamed protein product [Amoebophrya sp. A120]|eukprot:GSA120T00019866001.1
MTAMSVSQKELGELKRPGSRMVAGRRRAQRSPKKTNAASPQSTTSPGSETQQQLVSQIEKEMKAEATGKRDEQGRFQAAKHFENEIFRQKHASKATMKHNANINPLAFHTPHSNGFRHGAEK